MHIGFDAKRAFKNFTGLGNYSRATIAALAEFYPENDYFLYTPRYREHSLLSFANRENMKICSPEGWTKNFSSLWRSYGVNSSIARDKIQLYHGLVGELPIGLRSNVRSVVTIHDLIFLRYPEYYKFIDRKIYTRKYKSACCRADLIVAISEQTKRDVIDFYGIDEKKIRLVYQGCDSQFYASVTQSEKQQVCELYHLPQKYVLYVGTIEPRKNLLSLVKALPLLPDDVHLVAIGKPTNYFAKVQETIAKYKLENRVRFLHSAAFKHLPAIYQQAQAFCLPSQFEGFGIPVLEALNSQTPVVTSNVSCLPEAGGPNSLYVNPEDEKEIAAALNRILSDEELRKQMIAGGLEYAKLFREKTIAQNMWSVYKELL